jgi:rubrerythrin
MIPVKYLFIFYYYRMSSSSSEETELTDTAYDILKVLGKDADFIYDTIETYIRDAQKANKTKLVQIWQTIKKDRKRHMHMLKEALEEEIHG